MRRFDAERVHQPDGVGRHVAQRVRRGDRLAEQLLLDQRRQIRDWELLQLRRQADVAIVEPDYPKTPIPSCAQNASSQAIICAAKPMISTKGAELRAPNVS